MLKASQPTSANPTQTPGVFVSRVWLPAGLTGLLMLALPTGIVAMFQGIGTLRLPYNLFVVDERLPGVFRLHMLASGLSMLVIPLAIYFARRRLMWHRLLGRVAAACVVLGALTSLPVALLSESVAMARAGFLAQGVTWLALLGAGIHAIRARRIGDHMRCMLAMAGVASGAIFVRLTTTVATSWDLPFDPLYACAAWLGWLIPMTLAWTAAPRLLAPAPRLV